MPRIFTRQLLFVLTALTVLGASASPVAASQFYSEVQPEILSGTQIGDGELFTFKAGAASCETVTYSGVMGSTTDATVILAPTYSGCMLQPVGSATISTNGCTLAMNALEPETEGEAEIVCPAGKKIQIVAKALGVVKCTITLGSQAELKSLNFENAGGGIRPYVNIPLAYSQIAGTGLGACATGSFTDGRAQGYFQVTGADSKGNPADFRFEWHTRFHSTAAESTTLIGKSSELTKFSFTPFPANCYGSHTGTQAAGTAESIEVIPTYTGCSAGGAFTTSVESNGCGFVFHAPELGAHGTADLTCPAGKALKFILKSLGVTKCTVVVEPQSGRAGVDIATIPTEPTTDLLVDVNLVVPYEAIAGSGLFSCSNGSYSNGLINATLELSGGSAGVWFQ